MIIVGGGSAGLYLASRVQSKSEASSEKITVLEEHKKLGLPVQCTGILTDDIYSLVEKKQVKKFSVNTINHTKIFSPKKTISLKIKDNIIMDNVKFVEYLAEIAEKNDAKIMTSCKYISNSGRSIKIKDLATGKIKFIRDSSLVGADGPQSNVALNNDIYGNRKFLLGMQARIKAKDVNKNCIDFYPYIGEYAWSVPENDEILRVGVAVPLNEKKHSEKIFSDFLKKYPGQKIEVQAGLIPLHHPNVKIEKRIVSGKEKMNVALVGDAALQIKNTTGGGIIPGLKAAEALSKGFEEYKKNIRNLNKELYVHYILNKALHNYNSNDWDRLIEKTNNEKVKNLLESTNRDNASKLIFSLATKKGMLSEGLIATSRLLREPSIKR